MWLSKNRIALEVKMTDVIRLLPDSVANQIAAGEVIQQPSSVVKELVENAVDAGATHISIILKDAGRTLIKVVDDGCGMSETDARLAFERHATSKITSALDLFALRTMGFRGEALASIAAVAQVELRTRRESDTLGTKLEISGSKVVSQEPCGTAVGSNLAVKNLFFNVPARRKFLKKDSVEFGNVVKEFERLALVNPEVDLTLIHNDSTIHRLGKASFKQRIIDLFGRSLSGQLIPVETETSLVKISGYVCRPENARRKGALQYLTVNGRNMRHPGFYKAVMECYDNLIAHDARPNFFLNFTVDPNTIDVNIHPTKNEIKFENEGAIRQILVAAIREAMGKFNVAPAIDFESTDVPDIPVFSPNANAPHDVEVDLSYNPFLPSEARNQSTGPHSSNASSPYSGRLGSRLNSGGVTGWESLYENFSRGASSRAPEHQSGSHSGHTLPVDETMLPEIASVRNDVGGLIQIKGRYLIAPAREGMMVVDRYRAHLNVLYHKYLVVSEDTQIASQTLLFPETVELSASESVILASIIEDINAIGFEIFPVGDNRWQVNALPAGMEDVNCGETIRNLVEQVAKTDRPGEAQIRESMAMEIAKVKAARSDAPMSAAEAEYLLSELLKLPSPGYLPDGRKVLSVITLDELGAIFR